jgi:hypothetical protein
MAKRTSESDDVPLLVVLVTATAFPDIDALVDLTTARTSERGNQQ